MKKTLIYLVLLLLFGSWIAHKFYVSLTEVRYNAESRRIEISMRVFPDDLDRVLLEQTGEATHLATEMESDVADSLLSKYIFGRFSLTIDGQPVKLEYLGKEPEGDALWCYLESEPLSEPVRYMIYNTVLTEQFEEQTNIVQVYQDKWNKGLLLNRDQRSGELTVGK